MSTKPFNPQVLLARIQNLLARTAAPEAGAVLTHKGPDPVCAQAKMRCGDKEAELTRNELGILRLLMRQQRQRDPAGRDHRRIVAERGLH